MFFATHFNRKRMEDLELLVQKQQQLIETYRQTTQDRDEIINHLKRLVNLQEIQIDELKSDLKAVQQNRSPVS